MVVEPDRLDFGEVWETDKFEWTVPIRNTSDQTVEITNISGGCTCASVEPTILTVPAGESRAVQLTLDLRARPGEKRDGNSRVFATGLTAQKKIGAQRGTSFFWQVQGRVRHLTSVTAVDFGRVSEIATPHAPFVIPLDPAVRADALTVTSSLPQFHVTVRPASGKAGHEVAVVADSGLKCGRYEGTVSLSARGLDAGRDVRVELPLLAEVAPDVEAIPAVISGARAVGAEFTETITLRSLSNRQFAVEQVEAVGDGLSVTVGKGNGEYAVRVRVASVGAASSRVRFVVRPAGGAPTELIVPVQVHGFSP